MKTKTGKEKIYATYGPDFNTWPILEFKKLRRNHKTLLYATNYMTLDTETSHDSLIRGWIYQWAIRIKRSYIYGRTPSELITFMTNCAEHYGLTDAKRIIIYIHNAAYDVQYLKHYLKKYDPNMRIFAIDNHSILCVDVLGFRILCSYKLTNLSLSKLSDSYAEKYIKAVGEIDYNIVRYQDSTLTPEDWYYMFSDVAAQYDGINGYLTMQGYKYAYNAPITSTGFVRAACRGAALAADWHKTFETMRLTYPMYKLCQSAFMGGVCIASWKYAGETIRSDKLRHKDFTSSYPARQVIEDGFPAGLPMWYGDIETAEELSDIIKNFACIFILKLTNVSLKQGITAPYIPSSKCLTLSNDLRLNGKIIQAEELSIAICDIDYKWICKQYDFDNEIEIHNLLIFERGPLPEWFKNEVMTYFNNKCKLKGVDDILYNKSKNMLNGIYGMTATRPVRDEYQLNNDLELEIKKKTEDDAAKALAKYYNSRNSFMPFQWSIYTTAYARDALFTMIECVGYDNFLYCDTDSVFYIETPENKKSMEEYRQRCIKRAQSAGAYVDNKFLGEPTDEPALKSFRALHSKCYALEEQTKDGSYKLNVTIAGVPKKGYKWINGQRIEKTNAEELQEIDNLEDGFIFDFCGGSRAIYIEDQAHIETINGHDTEISSAVIIDNIEKEISDTMWSVGKDLLLYNFQQNAE